MARVKVFGHFHLNQIKFYTIFWPMYSRFSDTLLSNYCLLELLYFLILCLIVEGCRTLLEFYTRAIPRQSAQYTLGLCRVGNHTHCSNCLDLATVASRTGKLNATRRYTPS